MNRRMFLGALAGGLLAAPLAAGAQQPAPRIALVLSSAPVADVTGPRPSDAGARAFIEGMRELGWVDGQNITIVRRSAEGRPDRYAGLIQDLLSLNLNLIVTGGASLTRAIAQATNTIPIVSAGSFADPVLEGGFAKSLARPGGNLTGLTVFPSNTLYAKRLELLKEAVPRISRIAFLGNVYRPGPSSLAAARALSLTLVPVVIGTQEEAPKGFATVARSRVDALFVADTATFFYGYAGPIVEFAAKQRLPDAYPNAKFVEAGGLMSYGANGPYIYRRAATYVDKILKGANPGDLPFEQPTKLELVINLKTAKALGLTIPPSLLQRADQVIE
jgi:putative ABC transport system substrate-binding protein